MKSNSTLCPCQSNKKYAHCCQPFHKGTPPSTPLELMRARYSAYALKKVDFLIRTTHPSNPDFQINEIEWKKTLQEYTQTTRFLNLEIIPSKTLPSNPERQGVVSFIATFLQNSPAPYFLHETSLFEKRDAQWLYKKALDSKITH